MTRVTSDVDVLNDLFTSGVVTIFGDVFTLVGIMVVMLGMNWRLALVAFSVLPLIVLVTQWFRQQRARLVPQGARLDRADQRVPAGEHHRDDDGAAVPARGAQLRALRRDRPGAPRREHRVDLLLRGLLPGDRGRRRARLGADHLVRRRQRAGDDAHARRAGGVPAVLAALLPADQRHVGEVQRPAGGDGVVRADLHAARRAGRRSGSPAAPAAPRRAGRRAHRVRPRLVRVQQARTDRAARRLLRGAPGQRVGIVGATGSGKTTLINLLLRFYDVKRGRITSTASTSASSTWPTLRGLFGLVLQDVHLFSGTIADNIRLGNPAIDDERVRRAAQAVHADAFIDRLPAGYASAGRRARGDAVGRPEAAAVVRARAGVRPARARSWTRRRRASTPRPSC